MTKEDVYRFMAGKDYGVLGSISPDGEPQCALVGIAVTPELELIFDTVSSSRKYVNLKQRPRAAFVIGWENEITLQYQGEARELQGADLERCQTVYFAKWPDGPERMKWPGITYFAVQPKWIRYSDFNEGSRGIEELTF